jgi:Phosphoglycerate dehydrogenase and related dehydrogenases
MSGSVLITTDLLSQSDVSRIAQVAKVYTMQQLEKGPDSILPQVDVLIIGRWPKSLDIKKMTSLKMVQSLFAGVDMLPFKEIPGSVIICSNAGAYSYEVAEHAVALMLAAAHAICISGSSDKFTMDEFSELTKISRTIYGKTAGIIGYGGIGKAFQSFLKGFNMKFLAYVRKMQTENSEVTMLQGRDGLESLLQQSDVILLSIPLTKRTKGMIGKDQLNIMKEDAIIVNVARGDIVDAKSMAEHLKKHPSFIYASDVGWRIDNKEIGNPQGLFTGLKNYVTTPHIAGLLSSSTGRPSAYAADNVIRFLSGKEPLNEVDREEY